MTEPVDIYNLYCPNHGEQVHSGLIWYSTRDPDPDPEAVLSDVERYFREHAGCFTNKPGHMRPFFSHATMAPVRAPE